MQRARVDGQDPGAHELPVAPGGFDVSALLHRDERGLEARLARLQAIFQLAPIGIGIVTLDGRTMLTNETLRTMLGYSAEEFASLHWDRFTHPEDAARNHELFDELASGRTDRFEMDKRFLHRDGSIVRGRLTVSLLRADDGAPALAIGMLEDVTERRRLEQQLREAEETYRLLVEQAPAVVYVAGLDLDSPWRYVSPQIASILGYDVDRCLTDPTLRRGRVHPDDLEVVRDALAGVVEADDGRACVLHYRMQRRDGTQVWVRDEFRVVREPDGERVLRGVMLDATREKELEATLEWQASHDPLTHLANRERFTRRVERCLQAVHADPGRADAVVFVDLDDFKTVNDSLGHAAGDELIRSVGSRLRSCLRAQDTAGRLGGDEFAVLLEDVGDPADVLRIARRVQRQVQLPHRLRGQSVVTSASLGVAYLRDAEDATSVLRNADLAMYRAKELGKGRVATYEPVMHAAAVRRLDLRTALEHALDQGQLRVELQPIVDLATTRMVGAEALLRWTHPVFGVVSPEDFVPVAEDTGAIRRIGAWSLEQATGWLADRHAEGHRELSVSVNVSPVQLRDGGFVEVVAACLARSGLPPAAVVLEVTEQALMSDRSWCGLAELDALGVGIAMDDFGTGYASLAYLADLAVDELKIDRAFVAGLDGTSRGHAVPRAVVQLAHSLDLTVVAEGVETDAQWRALLELGCELGQGFRFSPSVAMEQATRLIGRPLATPLALGDATGDALAS
jgi:diguanylate cyclase (GGDEF)-like protein/PAS domain S-box-containing protein